MLSIVLPRISHALLSSNIFLVEILFIQMIFKLIKYQQEMFDNEGERTLADAIFFEIFPN